jgi:hypothetical protein
MNTEQNYSAQDNCANPSDHLVSPAVESTISNGTETVIVNKHLLEAQTETLLLIQDFLIAYPIPALINNINDLLYRWLSKLDADLTLQPNRDQLHTLFQLIHFLAELNEKRLNWEYFVDQARKGGINHD